MSIVQNENSAKPRTFDAQWLQTVLDDVETGLLVEAGEEIAYINRTYALMLGYDQPTQLLHRPISTIVADCDAARLLRFSRMRIRSEPTPVRYEFEARRRDESTVRLHASVSSSCIGGAIVITTLVKALDAEVPVDPREHAEGQALLAHLTARERQVMDLILAGERIKQIAFVLQVSPKTITTHRQRLLQKLQLRDNRDLFRFALRHQLIDWR